MIEDYVQSLLDTIAACPLVHASTLTVDKRTPQAALLRGELTFEDGSHLYFRELVEAREVVERLMYSYHYQNANAELIFRYDDTPHHPHLSSFPHHKHHQSEANLLPTSPPTMDSVVNEIEQHLI